MAKKKNQAVLCVLHPGPNNPGGAYVRIVNLPGGVGEVVTRYGKPEKFATHLAIAMKKARPFSVLDDGTKVGFEVLEGDFKSVREAEESKPEPKADPEPKAKSSAKAGAKTSKGGKS